VGKKREEGEEAKHKTGRRGLQRRGKKYPSKMFLLECVAFVQSFSKDKNSDGGEKKVHLGGRMSKAPCASEGESRQGVFYTSRTRRTGQGKEVKTYRESRTKRRKSSAFCLEHNK